MAGTKKKMSSEHKAALAKGREQARAVRQYLDALEDHRPKRGRKRSPEAIRKRLGVIDSDYETASALRALNLLQERKNLEAELEQLERGDDVSDLDALERAFVKHGAGYAQAKGIAYGTWREIGVPGSVLKAAGISRSSS